MNSEKNLQKDLLESLLLKWYDTYQRQFPWRARPGISPNPYHVWLSEIMLQQTTTGVVEDYFTRFISLWPTIQSLSKATLDEIFHAWQGLGYYNRARNLHRCAQILVQNFNGDMPQKEEELLTLPGVGPYTAAAIAAIGFNQPTVPVDGNVVRVFSRLLAIKTPLPTLKKEIEKFVSCVIPSKRSGDFAQGLMDLGATICRPHLPACEMCPLQGLCKGFRKGIAKKLPFPAPKETKPRRYGIVFWIENDRGEILIEKRPNKGLLAGLMGIPTTEWKESPRDIEDHTMLLQAPKGVHKWEFLPLPILHTFTHFHLELRIAKGHTNLLGKGVWSSLDHLNTYAFPSVMKKVIRYATQAQSLKNKAA
ncbi:MAG: A/G-specific adenine glycosylase [Alphaproteobacteria bacterium]|nr:A/G-specific adenine glycosylase [Alphaproteobacteria bacterium]